MDGTHVDSRILKFTARLASFALVLSFLLQPATLALANENETEPTPVTDEVVEVEIAESADDDVAAVEDEVVEEEIVEIENENEEDEVVEVETEETSEDDTASESPTDSELGDSGHAPDDLVSDVGSSTANSNEEIDESASEEDVSLAATSTADQIADQSPVDTATTTTDSSSAGSETSSSTENALATTTTSEPESDDTTASNGGSSSTDDDDVDFSTTTESDNFDQDETNGESGSTTSSAAIDTGDDEAEVSSTSPVASVQGASTSTNATTTAPVADVASTTSQSTVTSNLNRHQFSEHQCVSVGDGAFYCSVSDETDATIAEDGVYAAPDNDGDSEIFITLAGETVQITDNNVEDGAPFYDARSNRVVWHQLVNDRYQIMSYDLSENKIQQLTKTSFNNMEPTAYGDITLWQSWMGSDWDIVMYQEGAITILTADNRHDVAPHMRGNHVVWQTQTEDTWFVAIYDIESGATEFIEAGSGGVAENPRFMLVYDTKDENGDIETVGYDLDNKVSVPLGVLPAELPEELPEPDQTGEERALLQTKPNLEDEIIDITSRTNASSSDPGLDGSESSIASTSENMVIIEVPIEEASETFTLDLTPEVDPDDETLVIEPVVIQATTTSTTTIQL